MIPSNDANENPVEIALGGTGSAPEITVSPLSIAFGAVPVGSASSVRTVTVKNDGTTNLVLGSVTLAGGNPTHFKKIAAQDLCSGLTLAPTQTCTLGIKFTPKSSGAQNATVMIPSNDADESLLAVTLSGAGL
jgi:hypothetical protein